MRLLLILALTASRLSAQETSLFGKKPSATNAPEPAVPATTIGASAPADGPDDAADTSVVITPFKPFAQPEAKETRTFSLAKMNRPLAFESTRELQRLFSAFMLQHVTDAGSAGFARAPGPITTIEYVVQQDLGDGRLLVKANWNASADGRLPAATEAFAVMMPEKAPAVGEKGTAVVANVGMVAVRFTPTFAPLTGRRLTMRREAFIECAPIADGSAGLQKFVDLVRSGSEFSVFTAEKFPCKTCGGLGFTREAQKGKLEDKRIPCTVCEQGKVTVRIETKFTP
jgi:hypothetical protein